MALALSCAQRPKPHQPQPEDSAKAQVTRVVYAVLDAWDAEDSARVQAYFGSQWLSLTDATPVAKNNAAKGIEWLDSRLQWAVCEYADLFELVPEGHVQAFSRYDLENKQTAVGEKWTRYINLLRDVNFLEPDDILVVVQPKPLGQPDGTVVSELVFVLSRVSGKWLIVAAE